MSDLATTLLKPFRRDDPAVEARISEGIQANRTGFGAIELVDAQGQPVQRARVRLKHTRHDYHFGCNLFMLDQFESAEQNAAYAERFRSLFNLAVVPFYWSDLEPQEGAPRFAKDSAPIYRRPPPDLCLEYCERHGITPKGHPLLWHCFWPQWLEGASPQRVRAAIARRFEDIAQRYAARIPIWDVANEAQTANGRMPIDAHVDYAFELAGRMFPGGVLTYNDDRKWWDHQGDYTPVYLLMRHLQRSGLRVDALGFQYHMFQWLLERDAQQFMDPRHLFRCLDQYAKLGVPLNLSEISIISRRDLGDGDAFQAEVVERLYRLWFSHPATNGLIWWNMVDGTAAYAPPGSEQGENSLRAGLVNYDLSPKKAWTVLERLIKREWTTDTVLDYQAGAPNQFRGFHGDYAVEIAGPAGTCTRTLSLRKGGPDRFRLALDG
jgi:endo-1,4-beta-xylanase